MTTNTILTYDDPFEIRDERPGLLWLDRVVVDEAARLGLGAYCLSLYVVLVRHANNQSQCDYSIPFLASRLGCAQNTIRMALHKLEDAGWITIQRRKSEDGLNYTNLYFLNPIVSKPSEGVLQEMKEGTSGDEGFTDVDIEKNVFILYEQKFGLTILGSLRDTLLDLQEMYSLDWIEEAFQLAVDNEAVNKLSYARRILANWQKFGKNGKPGSKDDDYDPLDAKFEAEPWQKNQ